MTFSVWVTPTETRLLLLQVLPYSRCTLTDVFLLVACLPPLLHGWLIFSTGPGVSQGSCGDMGDRVWGGGVGVRVGGGVMAEGLHADRKGGDGWRADPEAPLEMESRGLEVEAPKPGRRRWGMRRLHGWFRDWQAGWLAGWLTDKLTGRVRRAWERSQLHDTASRRPCGSEVQKNTGVSNKSCGSAPSSVQHLQ